jgi:hypothetical protein
LREKISTDEGRAFSEPSLFLMSRNTVASARFRRRYQNSRDVIFRHISERACDRASTTGQKGRERQRLQQCGGNKQVWSGCTRYDARLRGKFPD